MVDAINFGVTIKINDAKFGKQITGVYPSPSFPDIESVLDAVVAFLSEQLGETYQPVRVYLAEEFEHRCGDCGNELQIVRPGKYQCVHCENKPRRKKVKRERLESVGA